MNAGPKDQKAAKTAARIALAWPNSIHLEKSTFFQKKGTTGENVAFSMFFEGTTGDTTDQVEGGTGGSAEFGVRIAECWGSGSA